jgi:hypothetical protein
LVKGNDVVAVITNGGVKGRNAISFDVAIKRPDMCKRAVTQTNIEAPSIVDIKFIEGVNACFMRIKMLSEFL